MIALTACGDRCEVLCQQTAARVADCRSDSLTWNDLGADSRQDFVTECRYDWDRARRDLSANDVRLSLDVCADTTRELDSMTCAQITALFAEEP